MRWHASRLAGFLVALAASLGAAAQPPASVKCGAQEDLLARSDPLLAPVRPSDCVTVEQTPPDFTWPPQGNLGDKFTYTLTLTFPDGHHEQRVTTHNWVAWDRALPPGAYTWTVDSMPNKERGQPRRFTIAPDAVPFVLPGDEALLKHIRSTPHPRSFPRDRGSPFLALRSERMQGFRSMLDEVDGKMGRPVEEEPKSQSLNVNYEATVDEQKRTLAAALAYAVTHQGKYGDDAVRRLLAQAQWDAYGAIGFKNNDTANRNVAWTLALGYDWLYDYLQPNERRIVLAAIKTRVGQMYNAYVSRSEITRAPYDSHGILSLTVMAAISSLVAGDIPEADQWAATLVPMAVVWTSPWGYADGGFGNGTTQGLWDAASNLLAWYVIKGATGIDLSNKEWVRNQARFFAYFLPPGSPSGNFGDGEEQNQAELTARVAKALAAFSPTPIARWYAAQLHGEDIGRIEYLLAPRGERGKAPFPPGTPSGAVFPSIGWAAMHSDLSDPMRVSVYFRSSPYGAFNHSHADQNSFVINAKGERLAIASGYYDDYRTPHWTNWYKTTRAKNAITYDGGKGQGPDGKQFSGEIRRFDDEAGFDYVVGHAEKAYGGALTRAQRSLVYLRPGTVVVYDSLAAPAPHTWEWNIHALHRMQKLSDRKIEIDGESTEMCIEMLASPDVEFGQTDQFTTPPNRRSDMARNAANQWHGTFATRAKSQDAEFITLMRIGTPCAKTSQPTAVAVRDGKGWKVSLDGKTVELAGDNVTVR